jgi:hypothetical protein
MPYNHQQAQTTPSAAQEETALGLYPNFQAIKPTYTPSDYMYYICMQCPLPYSRQVVAQAPHVSTTPRGVKNSVHNIAGEIISLYGHGKKNQHFLKQSLHQSSWDPGHLKGLQKRLLDMGPNVSTHD